MNTSIIRRELHKQIEHLPEDILVQVADFASFVISKRKVKPVYDEWSDEEWQEFSLSHFFAEDDEMSYTLEDAQEIFIHENR